MSRMSDIHAAASEINTADADAVQALADSLAAERYAPDVARYADTVARIIERRSSILYDGALVIAEEISTTRYADRVAIHADAVRRIIEEMDDDSASEYQYEITVRVNTDENAHNWDLGAVMDGVVSWSVEDLTDSQPACRECGDSLAGYLPGTVKCDECADAVRGVIESLPICEHPKWRWLDCAECEEAGETCQMKVCTECGADVESDECADNVNGDES